MNKIKTMMMAAVALCAASMTSCTDKMDWGVDPAYDRLFGITTLNTTPDATSIEVEFKAPAGADRYVIQVSTDSLTDDVDEPASAKTIETTASPVTVEGLMGDTPYFLRIRAVSDSKKCSKWVYPVDSKGKRSVKTLKEQIMFPVKDDERSQDEIIVRWDASKEVTHLIVIGAGAETRIDLSAENKAAGEYTVTNLQPLTSYTFEIYNGASLRGSCTASTTAAVPKADYIYYMSEVITVLDNDIMKEIGSLAKAKAADPSNYAATIVIPAGVTIDMVGKSEAGEPASLKIPDGMSVTFFGAAGTRPTVKISKSVDLAGTHAYVRFENLEITDAGCQYFINQSAAANVAELSFNNCLIHDIERGCITRVQGSNQITIATINVDDCIIYNMPDSYYMFDLRGSKQNVGAINVSNTTIWNASRFVQNTGNDMGGGVNVTNTTFNDVISSGRYLVDCNGKNSVVNFNSVIIGVLKSGARGVRTNGDATYENVYQTSDVLVPATEEKPAAKFSSNDMKIEIQPLSAADIFTEPANGNFTLKIDDKVGDPRWYKPSAE